ncbi:MAG TPA: L,D-transpeptidase family protein [Steroidobacteraceae bacterium]|nr:L,D-transpeptidase family protein [Steroidobacteraceae bacterium]
MSMRILLLLACAALVASPARADIFEAGPEAFGTADHVIVRKSDRTLALFRDGQPLRSSRISLGLNPSGPKEQEGDFRTPEGRYLLTRRNPQSEFFLAIQVSYPGPQDLAAARKNGVRPGGLIMIHGLPNIPKHPRERYLSSDWTDGCIALSNEDMLEVWLLTRPDTPIEILP